MSTGKEHFHLSLPKRSNWHIATAIASLPFSATNLTLYPSFDNDYFKLTLTESYNVFVNVTSRYPYVEYPMSPYYTPVQDGNAIVQFYNEGNIDYLSFLKSNFAFVLTTFAAGALLATSWPTESKYTYAENVGPGTVYMRISPVYRAPGHVVWQYDLSVFGQPSTRCVTTTSTTAPPVVRRKLRKRHFTDSFLFRLQLLLQQQLHLKPLLQLQSSLHFSSK